MPKPLKCGILGASTMILSKDIDKYAFMCGSNFYETDATFIYFPYQLRNNPMCGPWEHVKCTITFSYSINLHFRRRLNKNLELSVTCLLTVKQQQSKHQLQ